MVITHRKIPSYFNVSALAVIDHAPIAGYNVGHSGSYIHDFIDNACHCNACTLTTCYIAGYNSGQSGGYTQVSSSLFTPVSTGLGQQGSYGNSGLGSLGSGMQPNMGSADNFGQFVWFRLYYFIT